MKIRMLIFLIITLFCPYQTIGQIQKESLVKNQEKFKNALAFLMQKLEKKNGIRFLAQPPLVRFTTPKDPQHVQIGFTASYLSETNTILFHSLFELCDTENFFQMPDLQKPKQKQRNIEVCSKADALKEVLCHELSHYYIDLLIERQFPESWLIKPKRSGQKTLSIKTQIGILIVSEGIATYFGKSLSADQNHYFNEERWEKKYSEQDIASNLPLRELLIYNGGHFLVAPILNQFGAKGIVYLINHPLNITVPDFWTVITYQKQALEELSQHAQNHSTWRKQ